jgi:hypothetical protein
MTNDAIRARLRRLEEDVALLKEKVRAMGVAANPKDENETETDVPICCANDPFGPCRANRWPDGPRKKDNRKDNLR